MKKLQVLLLLAALFVLLLPGMAGAEKKVEVSGHMLCAAGEIRVPVYPDLSTQIGEGLTQSDFIITYSSTSPYVTVDENGLVTISEAAGIFNNLPLTVTYTPRVEGVGETTHFEFTLRTSHPLTGLTADMQTVYMTIGPNELVDIEVEGGANQDAIVDISYDPGVITVERSDYGSTLTTLRLKGVEAGQTNIVVTGYNGLQVSIFVAVVDAPTKVEFASDSFTCYVGDTIDLGLDTGNGPYGLLGYPLSRILYKDGVQVMPCHEYLPGGTGLFNAKESGRYTVEISGSGYRGKTQVTVYDRANCAAIELSGGLLYQNQTIRVCTYDETGASVLLPMTITEGADIARLEGQSIIATGEGTVVVTVENADGTTTSQSFEVICNPTRVSLNAEELTLNIGDTFDFEVTFDRGSAEYTLMVSFDDNSPESGLFPVRLEEQRLTAQAPGTALVTVSAGELTASCIVTVPDSDAAVRLVTPEGMFSVGDTFQLSVVDGTGKTLSAVFYARGNLGAQAATVTPEGLLTGCFAGTNRICAQLEDGRLLYYDQVVVHYPTTMTHPDLTVHENYTVVGLEPIQTDAGTIYANDVTVSVADESVATYDDPFFTFHKPGTTQVTLTAINGGAQTSFILTVLPADGTLYIFDGEALWASGYFSLDIPAGYYMTLPPVVDYYGNVVPVTWEITYHVAGSGNPKDYGFVLDGDKLACSWSAAYCQLTGTSASGETIRISAYGYRLAEEIRFQMDSYTLGVGESKQTEVTIVEMGYELGPITWHVEDEGIVEFVAQSPQTGRPTVTGLKPGVTTLTAVLINGATASCTITVEGEITRLPGDANDDGKVNIMDALLVLQYDVDWDVAINRSNADVNGSGTVDIMDALTILQYDVGWDVELK